MTEDKNKQEREAFVVTPTDAETMTEMTRRVPWWNDPGRSREDSVRLALEAYRHLAALSQPQAGIDIEAMLKACVPGGSVCDPQVVADAIREYCSQPQAGGTLSDAEREHIDLVKAYGDLLYCKGSTLSATAKADWSKSAEKVLLNIAGNLRAILAAHSADARNGEGVALSADKERAYDSIDRFLRNNLCDEDYAQYSAELDSLIAAPAAPAPKVDELSEAFRYLDERVIALERQQSATPADAASEAGASIGLTSERIEQIAAAYFHQDDTELGDVKTAIRTALREAGNAEKASRVVCITAKELLDALELAAPDAIGADTDRNHEQMDTEMCIGRLSGSIDDDGADTGPGLFAWYSEYPEEGVIPLRLDREVQAETRAAMSNQAQKGVEE